MLVSSGIFVRPRAKRGPVYSIRPNCPSDRSEMDLIRKQGRWRSPYGAETINHRRPRCYQETLPLTFTRTKSLCFLSFGLYPLPQSDTEKSTGTGKKRHGYFAKTRARLTCVYLKIAKKMLRNAQSRSEHLRTKHAWIVKTRRTSSNPIKRTNNYVSATGFSWKTQKYGRFSDVGRLTNTESYLVLNRSAKILEKNMQMRIFLQVIECLVSTYLSISVKLC